MKLTQTEEISSYSKRIADHAKISNLLKKKETVVVIQDVMTHERDVLVPPSSDLDFYCPNDNEAIEVINEPALYFKIRDAVEEKHLSLIKNFKEFLKEEGGAE